MLENKEAGAEIRTPDLLITNQLLYRLSYASNLDSGQRHGNNHRGVGIGSLAEVDATVYRRSAGSTRQAAAETDPQTSRQYCARQAADAAARNWRTTRHTCPPSLSISKPDAAAGSRRFSPLP